MDTNKFREAMQVMAEAFSESLSTERLEIYYQYLGHIDENTFSECCKHIIGSEKFFPKIAVFMNTIKENIQVPSQADIHRTLTNWMMNSTIRDIGKLSHPIYQMMADAMGLLDRFSIAQSDFDNDIKYKYKRIVDEYRTKIVTGEQLELPEPNKRDLYPYANRNQPKRIENGFNKLKLDNKFKLIGKDICVKQ